MTTKVTPYWHGMLCAETRDGIVERMRAVLDGNYFTFVACNSYDENSDRFTSVDVSTSHRLTDPMRVWDDDEDATGISWSITGYSMSVHTEANTQTEGRNARPHGYVHFSFEPTRIVIDHYAPAGYRLQWIFAVEHHDDGDQS